MKKKIGLALFSIATFMFATYSASALTSYEFDGWVTDGGYGSAVEVDENVTNVKGNATATDGMYLGPFSKASTAKLEDEGGIVEELNVWLDPEDYTHGEFFDLSLGLKNADGNYVTEVRAFTQKVGDAFKITFSVAPDFETTVTSKGVYTYHYEVYVEDGKTYATFTLLQGKRELAKSDAVELDGYADVSMRPIADQEGMAVKYLWFDSIYAAYGVDVYTKLPTVNITFIDPTGEDDDLVLEVYKYTAFTEDEANDFVNTIKEAAEEENYNLEGLYLDEDYTTEFDLSAPFEEDVTVYLKVTVIPQEEVPSEETPEVLPPQTSDINLPLILSMILVAVVGTVFALRKRFAKSN